MATNNTFESLMMDITDGLAYMLNNLAEPLGYFILYVGIIGAVIGIVFAIVYVIRKSVDTLRRNNE